MRGSKSAALWKSRELSADIHEAQRAMRGPAGFRACKPHRSHPRLVRPRSHSWRSLHTRVPWGESWDACRMSSLFESSAMVLPHSMGVSSGCSTHTHSTPDVRCQAPRAPWYQAVEGPHSGLLPLNVLYSWVAKYVSDMPNALINQQNVDAYRDQAFILLATSATIVWSSCARVPPLRAKKRVLAGTVTDWLEMFITCTH